jgi:hypothetical protein
VGSERSHPFVSSPVRSSRKHVCNNTRHVSVVASTHLPSYVTSIAVMAPPSPGNDVFAWRKPPPAAYRRILPSSAPTTTSPSPVVATQLSVVQHVHASVS